MELLIIICVALACCFFMAGTLALYHDYLVAKSVLARLEEWREIAKQLGADYRD